jgi:enolase
VSARIEAALARSIYDSRGRPTIEVELCTAKASGRGIAPAGASTGAFEAHELRDADGLGVERACERFRDEIAPLLIGADCREQAALDTRLIERDGTATLGRLGANTVIATSLALLATAAADAAVPLWRYLSPDDEPAMPLPEIQMLGGGAHAHGRIDLQDIMALPVGAPDWRTALDWCARVYRAMGELLAADGRLRGVADEGGFWPDLDGNEAALTVLVQAIERAGLKPLDDVAVSLDVAANQFFVDGRYWLAADAAAYEPEAWRARLVDWCQRYPVLLLEDPCAEADRDGFEALHTALAAARAPARIVGDDLVVTDAARIEAAVGLIDAALIKPNQAGTISAAHAACRSCATAGILPIVSARSGETEDTAVMHLAVGWHAPMVKVGSITRGERTAKWNEGIRIAEQLAELGRIPPLPRRD